MITGDQGLNEKQQAAPEHRESPETKSKEHDAIVEDMDAGQNDNDEQQAASLRAKITELENQGQT